MKTAKYKTINEYFLCFKIKDRYYRLLKFEQGEDKSFYIKWNLSLAKSKDGDYSHRSYISYHRKYDKEKGGYKCHIYGCGSNRITESEQYKKLFVTDYPSHFFSYEIKSFSEEELISEIDERDIVFEIDGVNTYDIFLFSDKRSDLLDINFNDTVSKKIELSEYYLIVCLKQKTFIV